MGFKMWSSVVLAGALLVVPVAAGPGPPMPVGSLFDVGQFVVRAGPAGTCKGQPVAVLVLQIAGVPYGLLATERRFVLADAREGDGTDVWLGRIEADGRLTAQQHMPYGELTQRFPNMCQALVPLVVEEKL